MRRINAQSPSPTLCILAATALVLTCGEPTDSLRITVVKAGTDLTDNPLANVDTLRIVAKDAQYNDLATLEFNPFDGTASFSSLLPTTGQVRFEAVGLDGSTVVARGGTAFVQMGAGDLDVALFMGRVDTFHATMTADRSPSNLPYPLSGHSTTRLKDGQVLIVGGAVMDAGGGITDISNKVLVYDPNSGLFEELNTALRIRRAFHTATLLKAATQGGPQRVLISGGISLISGERLESTRLAEIFDPETMRFTSQLLEMRRARYGHTATLLISGDVLVAGGAELATGQLVTNRPAPGDLMMDVVHDNADLFQFGTVPQGFAANTIEMSEPRMFHVAARGAGKLVLVAGGQSTGAVHQTTELFNPDGAGSFMPGVDLLYPRTHATMTRLGSDILLIVGGLTALDSPASATYRVSRFMVDDVAPGTVEEVAIESRLANERWRHHAVLMSDRQQVLISGGLGTAGFTLSTAELITDGSPTQVPPAMPEGRVYHASAKLLSGDVLLVGGVSLSAEGGAEPLLNGTIYTPELVGD
jgi:hypothetical protein